MQRARVLSQEGERLIGHKHYAVDSIRPKCHELRHLCDQFAADLERRRGLLGKSLELHSLLEAVGLAPPLVLQSHSHRGQTTGAGWTVAPSLPRASPETQTVLRQHW